MTNHFSKRPSPLKKNLTLTLLNFSHILATICLTFQKKFEIITLWLSEGLLDRYQETSTTTKVKIGSILYTSASSATLPSMPECTW
jgi:hypothetical protein